MTDIDHWTNDIHTGDAADTLADLPESSVHMVMTSPPYFGLRDYGVDGQIGLENELDEYIEELVNVFREVRRVLRPDGSAWLNLGDTYSGGSIVRSDSEWTEPGDDGYEEAHNATTDSNGRRSMSPLGKKNKMLVPHRVAIALQDDGWIVRNDVTWAKPNPMPSSVKDRLNTTTEQVFHLVPEPDYWYDLDAIREPYSEASKGRYESTFRDDLESQDTQTSPAVGAGNIDPNPAGKNPGDVFEVTTKPFPEAHFAVYPPELVEKPLKATCPPTVCAECGSPYERVATETKKIEVGHGGKAKESNRDRSRGDHGKGTFYSEVKTGWEWEPTCDCDTDATEPGIALDPFAGAGTTALVAKRHGRRFVGIDLNEEYVAMAQKRLGLTVDNPEYVRDNADAGLEEWT